MSTSKTLAGIPARAKSFGRTHEFDVYLVQAGLTAAQREIIRTLYALVDEEATGAIYSKDGGWYVITAREQEIASRTGAAKSTLKTFKRDMQARGLARNEQLGRRSHLHILCPKGLIRHLLESDPALKRRVDAILVDRSEVEEPTDSEIRKELDADRQQTAAQMGWPDPAKRPLDARRRRDDSHAAGSSKARARRPESSDGQPEVRKLHELMRKCNEVNGHADLAWEFHEEPLKRLLQERGGPAVRAMIRWCAGNFDQVKEKVPNLKSTKPTAGVLSTFWEEIAKVAGPELHAWESAELAGVELDGREPLFDAPIGHTIYVVDRRSGGAKPVVDFYRKVREPSKEEWAEAEGSWEQYPLSTGYDRLHLVLPTAEVADGNEFV